MTKEQFLSLKPGDLLRRIIPAGMSKRSDNLLMFIKRQEVQLESFLPSYYTIYHFDFYVGTITKFGSTGRYEPWKYYDKA